MNKKDAIAERLEKNLPGTKREDYVAKKDIKDDYEFSRDTYKELIAVGTQSMDSLAELARESEHPRAFEVLSRAIKDVADTTDKLMELQKNKKALNKEEEEAEKKRLVTNNNLFVGSTADLQKMILDKDFIDAED